MSKFLRRFVVVVAFLFVGSTGNSVYAASSVVALPGQMLTPDQAYYSPNGRYFLVFQSSDGNLVVYRVGEPVPTAIWAAGSTGGIFAVFQPDGNLVVYRAHGGNPADAVWNSGTGQVPQQGFAPEVRLFDDGLLQVTGAAGRMFSTPRDPSAAPDCQLRQYLVCVMPGSVFQITRFIQACNAEEALRAAAGIGAVFGPCPPR